MRILHVVEAAGGGVLGMLESITAGAAEAGHDVTVAAGRRPETPMRLADAMPATVETVELPWARRTLPAQLSAAHALRGLIRERRPDVIHLHSSFAGAVGLLVTGDTPTIYTPHGYAFARNPGGGGKIAAFRAVERRVAHRAAIVAAVSEAEAELARRYLGAPRVAVVPNGIPELDALSPVYDRATPKVVVAGRVCEARRPEASTRILSAVSDVAEVCWIGAAPRDEDAPLHAAGIPLTGWLDHDDALDLLADATVLLHWSEWDGAPLAVLEAMARDVVVVASDIAPNRELLGPDQVRADEAGAIELIRSVLADRGLRADLLAAQRERAATRGAGRMVRDYLSLYEAVACRHPSPALAIGRTIESSSWS